MIFRFQSFLIFNAARYTSVSLIYILTLFSMYTYVLSQKLNSRTMTVYLAEIKKKNLKFVYWYSISYCSDRYYFMRRLCIRVIYCRHNCCLAGRHQTMHLPKIYRTLTSHIRFVYFTHAKQFSCFIQFEIKSDKNNSLILL